MYVTVSRDVYDHDSGLFQFVQVKLQVNNATICSGKVTGKKCYNGPEYHKRLVLEGCFLQ